MRQHGEDQQATQHEEESLSSTAMINSLSDTLHTDWEPFEEVRKPFFDDNNDGEADAKNRVALTRSKSKIQAFPPKPVAHQPDVAVELQVDTIRLAIDGLLPTQSPLPLGEGLLDGLRSFLDLVKI